MHGYTRRKEDINIGASFFSSQGYAIFAIDAPLDGLYYAQDISPRPLLMQNGRFDILVPLETNKLLYEKAKE